MISSRTSAISRTLLGGAQHIERADSLVGRIARQLGLESDVVREIVALVDDYLGRNQVERAAA